MAKEELLICLLSAPTPLQLNLSALESSVVAVDAASLTADEVQALQTHLTRLLRVTDLFDQPNDSSEHIRDLTLTRHAYDSLLAALQHFVSALDAKAAFVCAAQHCDSAEAWVTPVACQIATKICRQTMLEQHDTIRFIERILTDDVRPIFSSSFHASVNPDSGRLLERPRGGDLSQLVVQSQDLRDGWRDCPACSSVLQACVRQLGRESLETVWHLLVPPLMLLLDDHQTLFRWRGLRAAQVVIATADASLLRRTGLSELMFRSFAASLTYLSDDKYANTVEATGVTQIQLIKTVIEPTTIAYVDRLAVLLEEGVFKIWSYASDRPALTCVSLRLLLELIDLLEIFIVRFLKSIIPHLLELMQGEETLAKSCEIRRLASVNVDRLMRIARPRIHVYAEAIFASLVRGARLHPAELDLYTGLYRHLEKTHPKLCEDFVEPGSSLYLPSQASSIREGTPEASQIHRRCKTARKPALLRRRHRLKPKVWQNRQRQPKSPIDCSSSSRSVTSAIQQFALFVPDLESADSPARAKPVLDFETMQVKPASPASQPVQLAPRCKPKIGALLVRRRQNMPVMKVEVDRNRFEGEPAESSTSSIEAVPSATSIPPSIELIPASFETTVASQPVQTTQTARTHNGLRLKRKLSELMGDAAPLFAQRARDQTSCSDCI
ncbi:uncharacterized protein L969DRAFT_47312 [Mixia osmundae IAM 14324]|uniref:Uncharacterized protein n=1 Tax=Mixia osmundae (strain CBS 9802 / IAM 14324 / JCM 22182 / KY 12970) TaxID=764103 RepID=G7E9X7_MIXOS|nr:uncharacterized protein L969DRAFT_47312 [Mixia osmundae IAM 14324]KEI40080.1 hypothetical protein L969DRAFT_47312 [Mixia osmundae IAM 14324]GAA99446.1 hypothetical protein E5Q_06145 [Mixia osmundae IAM 14324]